MPPGDLLQWLRRRPFEPFFLVLAGGERYEVRHPEMVLVTPGTAVVGTPDADHEGLATRYDLISLRHVQKLEPMQATPN